MKGFDEPPVLVERGLCGGLPTATCASTCFGTLGVQVRVTPEPAVSAMPAPFHSPHARAVLELCHGDPWLSALTLRRGAHVAPSCDLHSAFLVPKWTSAVLVSSLRVASGTYMSIQAFTDGAMSRLPLSLSRIMSACSRHQILLTLKLSLPRTCVLFDRVLRVLRPTASFSRLQS